MLAIQGQHVAVEPQASASPKGRAGNQGVFLSSNQLLMLIKLLGIYFRFWSLCRFDGDKVRTEVGHACALGDNAPSGVCY